MSDLDEPLHGIREKILAGTLPRELPHDVVRSRHRPDLRSVRANHRGR